VLGGLLVGFGTRLGNGCTSGHGVCGIARLSRRSLAATAVFMLSAAATVFVLRHAIEGEMFAIATASASGLVFGLGLVVSQMVNPAKVLNFLDIFGGWDPSLASVMAGTIPVAAVGFALAEKMGRPVAVPAFRLPHRMRLDADLSLGAALFGIGWCAVGYCPGPAIVSL
jgi:uncharacterized membrane protein YedE/YeeE